MCCNQLKDYVPPDGNTKNFVSPNGELMAPSALEIRCIKTFQINKIAHPYF